MAEVLERVGVSSYSLYKWAKAVKPDTTGQQATELIEAKREILKKRRGTSPASPSEVPLYQ